MPIVDEQTSGRRLGPGLNRSFDINFGSRDTFVKVALTEVSVGQDGGRAEVSIWGVQTAAGGSESFVPGRQAVFRTGMTRVTWAITTATARGASALVSVQHWS